MEIKLFIEIPWILFTICSFLIINFSNCSNDIKTYSFLLFALNLFIGLFYVTRLIQKHPRKRTDLIFEFFLGICFILFVSYNLYLDQNFDCLIHIIICCTFIFWFCLRFIEIFFSERKNALPGYEEIL